MPCSVTLTEPLEQTVERKLACVHRVLREIRSRVHVHAVQVAWLTETSRVRDDDAIALAALGRVDDLPVRQDAVRLLRPRAHLAARRLDLLRLGMRGLAVKRRTVGRAAASSLGVEPGGIPSPAHARSQTQHDKTHCTDVLRVGAEFMDGEFTVGCCDPTNLAPPGNIFQLLGKLLARFADRVDRQVLHRVGLRDGVHVISYLRTSALTSAKRDTPGGSCGTASGLLCCCCSM